MGLGRVTTCAAQLRTKLGLAILATVFGTIGSHAAHAATPAAANSTITLAADRDDDDLDGKPDAEETPVSAIARSGLFSVDSRLVGLKTHADSGAEHVRMIAANGSVVAWGSVIPKAALWQGVSVGAAHFTIGSGASAENISIIVDALGFRDGASPAHDLDLTKERASLERLPPERAPASAEDPYLDFDALRALLILPAGSAALDPRGISVESLSSSGLVVDRLEAVRAVRVPCDTGASCFATEPLRFVVDDVDRSHILVESRSLRAEVGGGIVLRYAGRSQTIRVEGPRASPVGPISRLRLAVRPFVIRVAPKGGPSVGGNDPGAVLAVRTELALASAAWGQCGITFGKTDGVEVKVVDPPSSYLVSFGDDLGLPASGGTVHVRIDGKAISSVIPPGSSPVAAARAFAVAVNHGGFSAVVSPNVRVVPAADGSADVIVHSGAALAKIEPPSGAPITDDASLVVRIGSVDLSDGLFHFGDMDSMSGTLE
ncbi:MAG: hypothetical protein ABI461_15565, partial [Polyangiaceae bacterium]